MTMSFLHGLGISEAMYLRMTSSTMSTNEPRLNSRTRSWLKCAGGLSPLVGLSRPRCGGSSSGSCLTEKKDVRNES